MSQQVVHHPQQGSGLSYSQTTWFPSYWKDGPPQLCMLYHDNQKMLE